MLCIVIAWLAQFLFWAYQSLVLTLCKSTFFMDFACEVDGIIKHSAYGKDSAYGLSLP